MNHDPVKPDSITTASGPIDSINRTPSKIMRFFMKTNCVYLISAALLLLGAYLMMHSPILSKDSLIKYIEIYGILEVYEVLLIVICLFVLRRLTVAEDGLILAGIEVFLFLDPTFFNNAFYAFNLTTGLIVNGACLVFMIVKYIVIVKIGRIPRAPRLDLGLIITAGFVYLYPVLLCRSYDQVNVDIFYYAFCWVPLLAVLVFPSISQNLEGIKIAPDMPQNQQRNYLTAVILISFYIVVAHLIESAFGYHLTFRVFYLAPLLLSTPLLIVRFKPEWLTTLNGRQYLWISNGIAFLFALYNPPAFTHTMLGFTISPYRLTVAAIAGLHAFFWKRLDNKAHGIAALVYTGFFLAGYNIENSVLNMLYAHLLPILFLAIVFSVLAFRHRTRLLVTIAGVTYLMLMYSILRGLQPGIVFFLFWQAMGYWLLWRMWNASIELKWFYRSSVLILLFIHALTNSFGREPVLFYMLYFYIVLAAVFIIGYLIKSHLLKIIPLVALLLKIIYGKNPLIKFLFSLPKYLIQTGIVIVALAFAALLYGYYISTLKHRLRHPGKNK